MTFAKPASVSEAQVYWFDDTGRGSVRVPQTWRLLYRDGVPVALPAEVFFLDRERVGCNGNLVAA